MAVIRSSRESGRKAASSPRAATGPESTRILQAAGEVMKLHRVMRDGA